MTACIDLHETSVIYASNEEQIHLRNLEAMLNAYDTHCHGWRVKIRPALDAFFRKRSNHADLPLDIETQHLEAYVDLLHNFALRQQTAQDLLSFFCGTESWWTLAPTDWNPLGMRRTPAQEIFQTRIRLCNNIARSDRGLIYAYGDQSNLGRGRGIGSSRRVFGIGTRSARAGDTIILVPGVTAPLIVRKNDSGDGVRVVSPVMIPEFNNGEVWRGLGPKVEEKLEYFTIT